MSAALDFAETGEDLVTLVAGLARATQGRFDGQAGTALETARSYIEAAVCGFSALAFAEGLTDEARLAASRIATGFREAQGIIATSFAGGDTYTSLASLAARSDPERNAMEEFFSPQAAPLVIVTSDAHAAIENLRRDPFDLASLGAEAIRTYMAVAYGGVTVARI